MKILVSGSHGLVGSALVESLRNAGHQVVRLVRSNHPESDAIVWNPKQPSMDLNPFEGFDAVVHLAGENIASGRWSDAKKERIRNSRVEGTRQLAAILSTLTQKPKVLVNASAIGFYGNRGEEVMTESSEPGKGFLPEVCKEWEQATKDAEEAGIRVVRLRIGVVLSKDGGALSRMLIPFKFGLGGVVGSGAQYMSWITLQDLVRVVTQALEQENLRGSVNAVSPHPVTNKEFTRALGKVLHRPTIFPLPAFVAKVVMGEMAEELLLSSTRVVPEKLLQNGFVFKHPKIDEALESVLV